jgi:hypothetical protein
MTTHDTEQPKGINRRRLVLRLACLPVFIALLMFLPAGTWAWPKGWLFVLVLLVVISAVFLVLHRVNPEVNLLELLARHSKGDWGDVCEEDAALNDEAVIEGSRVLSAYTLPKTGERVWIITEADRSSTCALRPDEY